MENEISFTTRITFLVVKVLPNFQLIGSSLGMNKCQLQVNLHSNFRQFYISIKLQFEGTIPRPTRKYLLISRKSSFIFIVAGSDC